MSKLPTVPKRRDVKTLRAELERIQPGDIVEAVFREERYGTYRVTGTVHASSGDKALLLGGVPLDSAGNRKPPTNLYTLSVLDEEPLVHASQGTQAPTASVVHGDVVNARFFAEAYGAFHVTGSAVAKLRADGDPRRVMVGPWILSHQSDSSKARRVSDIVDPTVSYLHTIEADAYPPVDPIPYENEDF